MMPRQTTRSARRGRDEEEDLGPNDERIPPRSRRSRDDDEDERPRSAARRRSRDEDEEDRAPREHSRRSRRDDDEDERPSRGSRSSRHPRDDDDDERSGARRNGATSTTIGKGRDGLRRHRETHKSGGFPERFTVGEDEVLLKFLEPDFFITYYEHWIKEFQGQKRQMSFVCLGDDCPLCDIGDDPKFYALINVLDLTNPNKPEVKVWYLTPQPAGLVEEFMEDDKTKPIDRPDMYFVASKRKKSNKFYEYKLQKVKARDLEEEFDVEPFSEDELADFADKLYDEDIVRITPRKDLREIADELDD